LEAAGLAEEVRSSAQTNPARNAASVSLQLARTQKVECACTLEKRETGMLAKIHATLDEMKVPLGRVKTPGLHDLLAKQLAEYQKAHNETCREWRSAVASERNKAESLMATRSVNAQIELSQAKVLEAISNSRDWPERGSQLGSVVHNGTDELLGAIDDIKGRLCSQQVAIDAIVAVLPSKKRQRQLKSSASPAPSRVPQAEALEEQPREPPEPPDS